MKRLLLFVFFIRFCFGANIYVSHTGTNAAPYDIEPNACTNLQTALDAASAGDTVWIKADSTYTMNGSDQQAATFDLDQANTVYLKGYYATPGDQDYDGLYYKDSTNGYAVISANSGSYNVFTTATNKRNFLFENLKLTSVKSTYSGLYMVQTFNDEAAGWTAAGGTTVRNCWFVSGKRAIYASLPSLSVIDCYFTGTFSGDVIHGGNQPSSVFVYDNRFHVASANSAFKIDTYNPGGIVVFVNNSVRVTTSMADAVDSVGDIQLVCLYNTIDGSVAGYADTAINGPDGINCFIRSNIVHGWSVAAADVYYVVGGRNCFYDNDTNPSTLLAGDTTTVNPQLDSNGYTHSKKCVNQGRQAILHPHPRSRRLTSRNNYQRNTDQ